tara:strand:+ start:468 stop:617 length:150 start_codon:yes stop_codon:yes gene_type:complete
MTIELFSCRDEGVGKQHPQGFNVLGYSFLIHSNTLNDGFQNSEFFFQFF